VELPNSFDAGLGKRKATYKLYPQATPSAFAIEKKGVPPCRAACPAGVNAQGYIQLIHTGRILEAWQLIYRDNPLPAICGRVCTHPCQEKCHRGKIEAPVNIRHLKRLAADTAYENAETLPLPDVAEPKEEKIAVIGSGPAGLAAARQLALKGYRVTIFEALPVAGGMLRVGIPEYRLPKQWVELEIGLIQKLGVEIKTGAPLGPELTIEDLFNRGYRAVLLSTGAHKGVQPGIEGEELAGVEHAAPLLRRVNLGEKIELKGEIAVIGGGNVAMDAARTALRLGAGRVEIICLEKENEMPAAKEEIIAARAEGIIITTGRGIKAICGQNGRVNGMVTIAVRSLFDSEGRFRPTYEPGTETEAAADHVILAVGQTPDLSFAAGNPDLLDVSGRRLAADPLTFATPVPGVFACGDAVTGPRTIIDAIAAGKSAAESIDRYLQGASLTEGRQFSVPEENIVPFQLDAKAVTNQEPVPVRHADPQARSKDFQEDTFGYTPAEAKAEAGRCLNCGVCSECLECVKKCLAGAIDHNMSDEEIELDVGALILSPGFTPFDAAKLEYYGFGKYPNVLTSIQFERILSASGPYQGHLIRPSDGREPRKIAWIQCAGSRNEKEGKGYCSGVCCMYAIKQSIIAKEHSKEPLDTAIFFMDMRTHGKDFEKYYRRARDEHGVRFVRSRIHSVEETDDGSGNLQIRYVDEEGNTCRDQFDLVVLSVGLQPAEETGALAAATGIELDEYGFCRQNEFAPGCTSRPGVFVSGAFGEPRDIPETVVAASAAAAHASSLLSEARGTLVKEKEYPPERDVSREKPRVGVFVCNCGINIGGVINIPSVVEHVKTLKNVVHAEDFLFTCSQDNVQRIKERIDEHQLNRVVVASCTPRTHAPLFQSVLREAGLNPYLYEQANIREHSSWVHRDTPQKATDKAKQLVEMAVAKARLLKPVAISHFAIDHRALVIGGGAAGMSTALSLAGQGFEVYLVEKENELGGNLKHLRYTLGGLNPRQLLAELVALVERHPLVHVFTGAEIMETSGHAGNFRTVVQSNGKTEELAHGATIIATGAEEARPEEYLYGRHPAVATQSELEEKLAGGETQGLKTVVMIQCVGSREEKRPYCSRICCSHAVKNALKIKELSPETSVYILYRDVRTYGLKEKYYTAARRQGVIFVRYDLENKPVVRDAGNGLEVTVYDRVLERNILIKPDLLALSTGVTPRWENETLSRLYKVPLTADGFFSEAHMKLRPVDFAAEGIYLCGMAHAPKLAGEAIDQAHAAAIRAVTLLSKERLASLGIVATVNEKQCAGCAVCVEVCPYEARTMDQRRHTVKVQEVLCQGCGACVAACPSGASQQKGFEKKQIMQMIDAALA
jgi:heterodisulfide reductase subunit A-like polyferredoxin